MTEPEKPEIDFQVLISIYKDTNASIQMSKKDETDKFYAQQKCMLALVKHMFMSMPSTIECDKEDFIKNLSNLIRIIILDDSRIEIVSKH